VDKNHVTRTKFAASASFHGSVHLHFARTNEILGLAAGLDHQSQFEKSVQFNRFDGLFRDLWFGHWLAQKKVFGGVLTFAGSF
jgi:hypothetical protein